jgi:hypothetical protein
MQYKMTCRGPRYCGCRKVAHFRPHGPRAGDLFSKLPLDSCSGEPCCQPKVILPTSCSGDANRGTDGEVDQLVDLGKKSDMFR